MAKVIISTDSISDLGEELLKKYDIPMISLHVVLDGEVFTDGVDVTPDDIYRVYEEKKVLPKTTAINIGEYEEFFEKLTADGSEVVHFCTGSGISSCYQNAKIAAADFDNVYVVDTLNLSTGSGLQVLAACEKAQAGKSAKEIAEEAVEVAAKTEASFFIDTLEFLYKGGRCSMLSMLGANVLKIRPSIKVNPEDGKMSMDKKFRGTYEKCLEMYLKDKLDGRTDIDTHRAFVTHSGGLSVEEEQAAVEMVKSYIPFEEIIVTHAGSTISSHCGPKTLGVLFITK